MPAYDPAKIQSSTFVEHIEFHQQLESTNDLATELLAHSDLPLPLLVLTEEQTAGRGRGNNSWWSSAGSITMSLIVDATEISRAVYSLPFVSLMAGLAVCRFVDSRLKPESAGVKWPNDVFVNQQKVAGLLVENPLVDSGRLIIGIGVNVNNSFAVAPPQLRSHATSLFDLTSQSVDLSDCVIEILRQLELVSKTSRDDLVREFGCRDALRGCRITVESGQQTISGACVGIDHEGSMRIADDANGGQVRTIRSGVIHTIDWQ